MCSNLPLRSVKSNGEKIWETQMSKGTRQIKCVHASVHHHVYIHVLQGSSRSQFWVPFWVLHLRWCGSAPSIRNGRPNWRRLRQQQYHERLPIEHLSNTLASCCSLYRVTNLINQPTGLVPQKVVKLNAHEKWLMRGGNDKKNMQ